MPHGPSIGPYDVRNYLVEPAVPLEPAVGILFPDPAALLPGLEGGPALHLVLVHDLVVLRRRHLVNVEETSDYPLLPFENGISIPYSFLFAFIQPYELEATSL